MAFSPAWGGVIPLVPIGSFRDFLKNRSKGKEVREAFTGTLTRVAVRQALKTPAGKQASRTVSGWIEILTGFKPSPSVIAIELQGYIAFQKFQHRQAVKKRNEAEQRRIERIMGFPGVGMRPGPSPKGGIAPFPEAYFIALGEPTPGRPDTDDKERKRSFGSWFDRRKRRRGRFVNVQGR